MADAAAKPPIHFEVVGECVLSDAAISVLASILLDISDESTFTVSIPPIECNEPHGVFSTVRL